MLASPFFPPLSPLRADPLQKDGITAVFTDDSSISGQLMADVPAERARLSDCLNLPDKFLNVKVDDSICYMNKESLRKVIYSKSAE